MIRAVHIIGAMPSEGDASAAGRQAAGTLWCWEAKLHLLLLLLHACRCNEEADLGRAGAAVLPAQFAQDAAEMVG
jgi:hypothetical protein